MSKYVAKIEIGPFTENYKGDDPNEIIREIASEQDFDCLLRMGRMQESEEDQGELDKLEAFLDKYHGESLTMEDIKGLDIHLSLGNIVCHDVWIDLEA